MLMHICIAVTIVAANATTALGQTQYAVTDTLAPYEVPYIVGEAQELITKLFFDFNGLKGNISEEIKLQLLDYIYEAFEDGAKGSIQSDLKYDAPAATTLRRSPIMIEKYASDFETEFDIKNVLLDIHSFQFTLPELQGSNLYEMYGAYAQYFSDANGDTLHIEPLVKLARFVVKRDQKSARLTVKIKSIAFLDPNKLPEFIEPEDLAILSQEYLKWRKEGSMLDQLDLMSSAAMDEVLSDARAKRESKARSFESSIQKYLAAKNIGDVISAADEFAEAEKLQRQNQFILNNKDEAIASLGAFIDVQHQRTADAVATWNYEEAFSLIKRNKTALGIWNTLSNREYQSAKEILGLENTVKEKHEHWKNYAQKIGNNTFRNELKKQISANVDGSDCSSAQNKALLAEYNAVLGLIALEEGEGIEVANSYFISAIRCKAEFALPKLSLATIYKNESAKAIDYYSDLIYFENLNPTYLIYRAVHQQKQKKIENAEEDFKQALNIERSNHFALHELSKLLLSNGKSNDAMPYLELLKVVSNDPIADILLAYSFLESEGYNSEKARYHASQYNRQNINVNNLNTLDSLIRLYKEQTIYYRTQTKQLAEAAKYYEKMFVLAKQMPQHYEEWAFGAECYYDLGNSNNHFERAVVFADAAIELSNGKSTRALLVRGRAKRDLEDYDESKSSLLALVEIDKNFLSYFELGETFYQQGKEMVVARVYFQDALEKLLKYETKNKAFMKYNYFTNLRIGQCFRHEQKTKMAEEYIKKAIKTKYREGEGLYELGLTYLYSNDKKGAKSAISEFDAAIKKGFDPYLAKSAKAEALLLVGDFKRSNQLLAELAVQNGERLRPTDWLNRSKAATLGNQLDAASNHLGAALALDPHFEKSTSYLNQLGIIELSKYKSSGIAPTIKTRALENAENAFRNATELEITDPVSRLGMSMVAFFKDDKTNAYHQLEIAKENKLDIPEELQKDVFKNYWKDKKIKNIIKGK